MRYVSHKNFALAKERRIHAPRGWIVTLLLVLLVGIPGQPAEAESNFQFAAAKIKILPDGDLTLCKGETKLITVWIHVWLSRVNAFTNFSGQSVSNQTISTTSTNTQVASISPGFGNTSAGPRITGSAIFGNISSHAMVNSYTQFEINAVDEGSTLITFTDDSTSLALSTPARPRADPKMVTVTVKECVFEVTGDSDWQIPEGFLLKLNSQFNWLIKPDQDGKFDYSGVLVSNSAELGNLVMKNTPGFTHDVKAYSSTVRIYGKVDWQDDNLEINLNYEPVKGDMKIDCKGCEPFEPYIGRAVEGDSDSFGFPWQLGFLDLTTSSMTYIDSHPADYINRFGARVTMRGVITLHVKRVYQ